MGAGLTGDEGRPAFAMFVGEGFLLAGRGNMTRPLFATAQMTFARVYGPDDRYAIAAGHLLAKASLQVGDAKRAVALLEDAVPRLERTRGATNFRTTDAQATLAAAHAAVGPPAEVKNRSQDLDRLPANAAKK